MLRPILANDEISPGRDGDVVARLDQVGVVRFEIKRELPGGFGFPRRAFEGAGSVPEDLSRLADPAIRAGKEDFISPVPHALAPCKAGGAVPVPAKAEVVARRIDVVEV